MVLYMNTLRYLFHGAPNQVHCCVQGLVLHVKLGWFWKLWSNKWLIVSFRTSQRMPPVFLQPAFPVLQPCGPRDKSDWGGLI